MNLLSTFYPSEIKDSTYVIPFEEWKDSVRLYTHIEGKHVFPFQLGDDY